MKTVLKNSMVAHVWAQQSQPEGRSHNGQFYFRGATIFSYGSHFPIASFVEQKGAKAVLFTTRSYSPTTGQHKSRALRALRDGVPVFYVEDALKLSHQGRREEFAKRLAEEIAAVGCARGSNAERLMAVATNTAEKANAYSAFFGLRWRLKAPEFSPDFVTKIKAQAAKAAAQKAAATRADILDIMKRYRAGEWAHEPWQLASRLTEDDRAEHARNRAPMIAKEVAAWRAGESRHIETEETLLRVVGEQIETSRGAEFPVEHGKRAFKLIAACRAKGETWRRNGHTVHLGAFQVDAIEPSGDVRAGCHRVKWSEIERCAAELGLT